MGTLTELLSDTRFVTALDTEDMLSLYKTLVQSTDLCLKLTINWIHQWKREKIGELGTNLIDVLISQSFGLEGSCLTLESLQVNLFRRPRFAFK